MTAQHILYFCKFWEGCMLCIFHLRAAFYLLLYRAVSQHIGCKLAYLKCVCVCACVFACMLMSWTSLYSVNTFETIIVMVCVCVCVWCVCVHVVCVVYVWLTKLT